jgi:hypothetical protein
MTRVNYQKSIFIFNLLKYHFYKGFYGELIPKKSLPCAFIFRSFFRYAFYENQTVFDSFYNGKCFYGMVFGWSC